jgi:hypothetical protein
MTGGVANGGRMTGGGASVRATGATGGTSGRGMMPAGATARGRRMASIEGAA